MLYRIIGNNKLNISYKVTYELQVPLILRVIPVRK
jgi:hypothetical protein